jgi:hypothetical protein
VVTLYCVDGSNYKGEICTYTLTYKNTTLQSLAATAPTIYGVKGYSCPFCKKHPLKVRQHA